ncbi:J domain-containing protein [Kaistia sp. MMO-174]|uniref:J domain-containing protein n=1 Tax=Kaistia sp. MMO-174 TaxID=3081256 RepID=UPI00301669DA
MSAAGFPLSWPPTFPRAKNREKGAFRTSLAGALKNVEESLRLFSRDSGKRIDGLVISSNVTLGAMKPADAGVAVWFVWDGLQVCIPVDRYVSVEANLQAIHLIIEARRVELRHGTLALVRASFAGFAALPAPAGPPSWKTVLGLERVPTVNIAKATIENAFRDLSKKRHPDMPGGSTEAMAELNRARDEALAEAAQ